MMGLIEVEVEEDSIAKGKGCKNRERNGKGDKKMTWRRKDGLRDSSHAVEETQKTKNNAPNAHLFCGDTESIISLQKIFQKDRQDLKMEVESNESKQH